MDEKEEFANKSLEDKISHLRQITDYQEREIDDLRTKVRQKDEFLVGIVLVLVVWVGYFFYSIGQGR